MSSTASTDEHQPSQTSSASDNICSQSPPALAPSTTLNLQAVAEANVDTLSTVSVVAERITTSMTSSTGLVEERVPPKLHSPPTIGDNYAAHNDENHAVCGDEENGSQSKISAHEPMSIADAVEQCDIERHARQSPNDQPSCSNSNAYVANLPEEDREQSDVASGLVVIAPSPSVIEKLLGPYIEDGLQNKANEERSRMENHEYFQSAECIPVFQAPINHCVCISSAFIMKDDAPFISCQSCGLAHGAVQSRWALTTWAKSVGESNAWGDPPPKALQQQPIYKSKSVSEAVNRYRRYRANRSPSPDAAMAYDIRQQHEQEEEQDRRNAELLKASAQRKPGKPLLTERMRHAVEEAHQVREQWEVSTGSRSRMPNQQQQMPLPSVAATATASTSGDAATADCRHRTASALSCASGKRNEEAAELTLGMSTKGKRTQKPSSYAFPWMEQMQLAGMHGDVVFINPDIVLLDADWHNRKVAQENLPPEGRLCEMLLFGEQGKDDVDVTSWLNIQDKAKDLKSKYPNYVVYAEKYTPGTVEKFQIHSRRLGGKFPAFTVPLVLGSVSCFPGKEDMYHRTVFVANECDRMFSSFRMIDEEHRGNVVWSFIQTSVEPPLQQLASGHLPIAVAFQELFQCRVMARIPSNYEYAKSFNRDYCPRIAERLEECACDKPALDIYRMPQEEVHMLYVKHSQHTTLLSCLQPSPFSIYSPDFLCANMIAIDGEAGYARDGPQKMYRMTCQTATRVLGCFALHANFNPLSTAEDVADEFGLSVRMCHMLAAQLQFKWLSVADRNHAACTIVGMVLCLLKDYSSAAALVQDVEHVRLSRGGQSLQMEENHAMDIQTGVEAGLSPGGFVSEYVKKQLTSAYKQLRKDELLNKDEQLSMKAIAVENVWLQVLGGQPISTIVRQQAATFCPSFRQVLDMEKKTETFIAAVVNGYNGMKPPMNCYDANGETILAVSWIHPLNLLRENKALDGILGYITRKMYNFEGSASRADHFSIATGSRIKNTTAYLISPLVLPKIVHHQTLSLAGRRVLVMMQNLRLYADLNQDLEPAVKGEEEKARGRGFGYTPLPVENITYDDSKLYRSAIEYKLPNEPIPEVLPLRGRRGLLLHALQDVWGRTVEADAVWADHTDGAAVQQRRDKMLARPAGGAGCSSTSLSYNRNRPPFRR